MCAIHERNLSVTLSLRAVETNQVQDFKRVGANVYFDLEQRWNLAHM